MVDPDTFRSQARSRADVLQILGTVKNNARMRRAAHIKSALYTERPIHRRFTTTTSMSSAGPVSCF